MSDDPIPPIVIPADEDPATNGFGDEEPIDGQSHPIPTPTPSPTPTPTPTPKGK